jgi:hypothetical protein
MTILSNEVDRPADLQRVWAGVIAADAVDTLDRVPVILPGIDDTIRWEDCRWQLRSPGTLPKRGDECVVVIDDNNELWITA